MKIYFVKDKLKFDQLEIGIAYNVFDNKNVFLGIGKATKTQDGTPINTSVLMNDVVYTTAYLRSANFSFENINSSCKEVRITLSEEEYKKELEPVIKNMKFYDRSRFDLYQQMYSDENSEKLSYFNKDDDGGGLSQFIR